MSREYIDLLTIGLIIFEAVWILTDPRTFKERVKSYFGKKIALIGLFTLIFFVSNYLSAVYFPLPISYFDSVGFILGLFLYIGGLVLAIWAKFTMKEIWGLPAEHHIKRQNRLITVGPFKYTRNPIYLGIIMLMLGYGFLLQSYFTFLALIPMWYFYRSAEKEEKLLEKHFGKEYLKYKEKVPQFI